MTQYSISPAENCRISINGICELCYKQFYLKDGVCFPCTADCVFCNSPTVCGICADSGMKPTVSGVCKKTCSSLENNEYCDDSVPKTCQEGLTTACKCGTARNCASCGGLNKCDTCLPNFKKERGECNNCEQGFALFEVLCIPSQNKNPDSYVSWGLSTGGIVGIVVGVCVVIGGIIGLSVWLCLRKRKTVGSGNIKVVGI